VDKCARGVESGVKMPSTNNEVWYEVTVNCISESGHSERFCTMIVAKLTILHDGMLVLEGGVAGRVPLSADRWDTFEVKRVEKPA
jgi:hypothetical protein